jgi:hypothetical protein
LDRIDRHMAALRQLIYRQLELVEKGRNPERALKLLVTLNDLMANYQTLRQRNKPRWLNRITARWFLFDRSPSSIAPKSRESSFGQGRVPRCRLQIPVPKIMRQRPPVTTAWFLRMVQRTGDGAAVLRSGVALCRFGVQLFT